MNNENNENLNVTEKKKVEPKTIFIISLICILVLAPLLFWLGKNYFNSENKEKETVEVEEKKDDNQDNNPDDNQDVDPNENNNDDSSISINTAKELVDSLYYINPLENYVGYKTILVSNLKEEMIFYTTIKKIIDKELYTTSTFDNSNDEWADNTQKEISTSVIQEKVTSIFGNISFNYYPNSFEYVFDAYEKQNDQYIGKTMITGATAESEYLYLLDTYQADENEVILKVLSVYYVPEEGVYKTKDSSEKICSDDCLEDIISNPSSYSSKLNSLRYIFEKNENDYKLMSIQID